MAAKDSIRAEVILGGGCSFGFQHLQFAAMYFKYAMQGLLKLRILINKVSAINCVKVTHTVLVFLQKKMKMLKRS